MNKKHNIKCSQCDMTFAHGDDYRTHWEKEHLPDALKQIENERHIYRK